MTGLEPRDFIWVISGRLAVSERIGGSGLQHRRVRREEEISWLRENGFTAVLSLLESNQNLAAYTAAGLTARHLPLGSDIEIEDQQAFFDELNVCLADPEAVLLVHRDRVDDALTGLLGGFLVVSGLIDDPVVATATIQEITGRPLGPEGRRFIPDRVG